MMLSECQGRREEKTRGEERLVMTTRVLDIFIAEKKETW